MKYLIPLLLILLSGCSGLKLKDVPQTLEKAANLATGPCAERVLEAYAVCKPAIEGLKP